LKSQSRRILARVRRKEKWKRFGRGGSWSGVNGRTMTPIAGRRCTTRPDMQRGIWVNGSAFRFTVCAGNIKFRSPALDGAASLQVFSVFDSRDTGLGAMISPLGVRINRLCFPSNNHISLELMNRTFRTSSCIYLIIDTSCLQTSEFSPAKCDSTMSCRKLFNLASCYLQINKHKHFYDYLLFIVKKCNRIFIPIFQ